MGKPYPLWSSHDLGSLLIKIPGLMDQELPRDQAYIRSVQAVRGPGYGAGGMEGRRVLEGMYLPIRVGMYEYRAQGLAGTLGRKQPPSLLQLPPIRAPSFISSVPTSSYKCTIMTLNLLAPNLNSHLYSCHTATADLVNSSSSYL